LRTLQSVPSLRTMFANMPALTFVGILVGGWLAGGCTSYRPQPLSEVALLEQAKTKNDGAVRISVAVLNEEQNKALFGASLVDVGIQPIWLRIENNDTIPYILFPHNVAPQAFSPLEAAYRSHYRFAPATNEEMDAYFVKRSIGKLVPPRATIAGVI
jgi:hypothetical protein